MWLMLCGVGLEVSVQDILPSFKILPIFETFFLNACTIHRSPLS